ncbi:MAG: hypothetical protein KAJ67_04785 [Gemmatimonadetes bacterium]|nr:hypothetical protein [Gemmatimonadota bacterium]
MILAMMAPASSLAQTPDEPAAVSAPPQPAAPVIDTVIVDNRNIFDADQAKGNFLFRLANGLHITTHPYVIRRELLFKQGEPYDSLRMAETERNLRARRLFTDVAIDTVREGDRLAAVVRTRDGWTTVPRISFSAASDGTLTAVLGVTDRNLLGTGNFARAYYFKGVDRDGVLLQTALDRLGGSPLTLGGAVGLLSDGMFGSWRTGVPYRAYEDRLTALYAGEAADRRILQHMVTNTRLDTTSYQRRAFINRFVAGGAPIATSRQYLRVGGTAEIRNESYILRSDTALAIPDTITGTVGGFVGYSRARFDVVRYVNGFGQEDVNLSRTASLSLKLAPKVFGWTSTGIGPRVDLAAGTRVGAGFIRASVEANALFNSAGLDSGRVVFRATLAQRPKATSRHVTVLSVGGGILDSPPPGGEFDLGFNVPPRGFPPHAFVGTRSLSGTLEHRWYAWERLFEVLNIGFAAFLDYGGAWYPEQSSRYGGNIGAGLRIGTGLNTGIGRTARIDVAYLFGDGVTGRTGGRWSFSLGPSFVF